MSTSNTFSILFWINSSRAKNYLTAVQARITVNGKRATISLKLKADIRSWDKEKQRAKGNKEKSRMLNLYLNQVYAQLVQCYQELRFKNQLITSQLIKATYLGFDNDSKTLLELIKYHNNKISNTLAAGSIRNFSITENYIIKFITKEKKTNNIFLKKLDYKFLCDFECFLANYWPKGHPKGMGQNTIMKHIQRLRKMVTLAYHMEWIDKDPFVRWKPVFEKREREFLSEYELQNMEFKKFELKRLERVRDLFIFSCYTGISYIDVMNLTQNNISLGIDGGNWIFTHRQKTQTKVKIPLLPKAQNLINKYKLHPMTMDTGTLFPKITNEKLNSYLKEVAYRCGIKKNLTFHMARHTFATTITLSNDVPIETVSKLLGHTKITTTQIYARVLERKVSNDMMILKEKLK
ncbi:site-specific integrase [Maribacter litoralis]|uniref:site-specific integrase n=1 Tax=Maribacter litoralis TaxID=2059726 RepID=UPI003D2E3150